MKASDLASTSSRVDPAHTYVRRGAMPRGSRLQRASRWLAMGLVATVMTGATPSRADEFSSACATAAEQAQALRDAGKLVESRAEFKKCMVQGCPRFVAELCETWTKELETRVPTVAFRITVDDEEVSDVRVFLDGTLSKESIDGLDMALNPGPHQFRFERNGAEPVEQRVVIRVGEKARVLQAAMYTKAGLEKKRAAEAAAASGGPTADPGRRGGPEGPTGFRFPLISVLAIGLGGAALATAGVVYSSAKSDTDSLQSNSQCSNNGACPANLLDPIYDKVTATNVLLVSGGGVVALGALFLVTANLGGGKSTTAGRASPPARPFQWGMAPIQGGGMASFQGRF